MKGVCTILATASTLVAVGCTHHTVEVKPIHMTVDVNIKVDEQLDRFFDFEDDPIAARADTALNPGPRGSEATP